MHLQQAILPWFMLINRRVYLLLYWKQPILYAITGNYITSSKYSGPYFGYRPGIDAFICRGDLLFSYRWPSCDFVFEFVVSILLLRLLFFDFVIVAAFECFFLDLWIYNSLKLNMFTEIPRLRLGRCPSAACGHLSYWIHDRSVLLGSMC